MPVLERARLLITSGTKKRKGGIVALGCRAGKQGVQAQAVAGIGLEQG